MKGKDKHIVADALNWLIQNNLCYRDVKEQELIAIQNQNLLKFAENKDGKLVYRFASHPRFGYCTFNMIERQRILQLYLYF